MAWQKPPDVIDADGNGNDDDEGVDIGFCGSMCCLICCLPVIALIAGWSWKLFKWAMS